MEHVLEGDFTDDTSCPMKLSFLVTFALLSRFIVLSGPLQIHANSVTLMQICVHIANSESATLSSLW